MNCQRRRNGKTRGTGSDQQMGGFFQGGQHEPSVILYVTRMRALIFPRESMEEQYEAAVKMISTHMPPKNVKSDILQDKERILK